MVKKTDMDTLNGEDVKEMLLYVAAKVIDNKAYLTEVDSRIGDGDHGIGMTRGMESATEALGRLTETPDPATLFTAAGRAMLMTMGGASGVIFGSLYMAGAKGLAPKAEVDAVDLAELFQRSLQAIQARGGAEPGDKTMVDALSPAVDAMLENSGKGIIPMFEAAAEAAREGMESTKDFPAKHGRARSLMERSIGYQDAGATSVWIIFRSMAEWVKNRADTRE
jgi:dihydroxyacetone kinase phosphoprotein-dependent L subunit